MNIKQRFHTHAAALARRFGVGMTAVFGTVPLSAPLSGTALLEQADDALRLLSSAACLGKSTAAFWESVNSCVDLNLKISEWVKLAHIGLVQVPGSVEEERLFSKLAYIRDERRNRLEEEHLNVCLQLATQSFWEFQQFPILVAVQKWIHAKPRRSAAYSKRPQPRQQQPIELSSNSESDEES